jgi:hypothetical protein
VVVVANLCGLVVTHVRIGKSGRSPCFEDLLRTSHHRARCGPLYHRVLVFCNASACFETSNTHYLCTLMQFKNSCNSSLFRPMYVMYYAPMLRCWQLVRILVKANHPCYSDTRGVTTLPLKEISSQNYEGREVLRK